MLPAPKAVIFDMDGVLIDSEPLWRRAMIQGFGEAGMPITEDQCKSTTGQRFTEVVAYWSRHFGKEASENAGLEAKVIDLLIALIETEGKMMPGVPDVLNVCASHRIPLGLATSSAERLMAAVLKKLKLEQVFTKAVSAQRMTYGKPHPEVFLVCAQGMGVPPSDCWVIEDSVNGVIAAKAAQMVTLAVPDPDHRDDPRFAIADHCFNGLHGCAEWIEKSCRR